MLEGGRKKAVADLKTVGGGSNPTTTQTTGGVKIDRKGREKDKN